MKEIVKAICEKFDIPFEEVEKVPNEEAVDSMPEIGEGGEMEEPLRMITEEELFVKNIPLYLLKKYPHGPTQKTAHLRTLNDGLANIFWAAMEKDYPSIPSLGTRKIGGKPWLVARGEERRSVIPGKGIDPLMELLLRARQGKGMLEV